MANELYQYPTPIDASVQVTLDNGMVITGQRGMFQGRDGYCVQIPATVTTTQGAVLQITHPAKQSFQNRGLLIPSSNGPALFCLDDVTLADSHAPVPEPPPIYQGSPQEIVNQVYQQGDFDLSTKDGCGQFTEACCTALHDSHSDHWGHIKKTGAQNQYNGHAVDALMLLSGADAGIWDIIYDSESPNAQPSWSYKGAPDPSLWYYPA
jgi:hypothetical protein